jgi:hypothetical protein
MIQLCTGHIGLNQHLFHIRRSETPSCPHCRGINVETLRHFLFSCPFYATERHTLRNKLSRDANNLAFLLSCPSAYKPLFKYIHDSGRFFSTFKQLTAAGPNEPPE